VVFAFFTELVAASILIGRIVGVSTIDDSFRRMSDAMAEGDVDNFREAELVEYRGSGRPTVRPRPPPTGFECAQSVDRARFFRSYRLGPPGRSARRVGR